MGHVAQQTVEIVKRAKAMTHIHLKETHFHLSRMSNDPSDFAVMARRDDRSGRAISGTRPAGRRPASTSAAAGPSASPTGPARKASSTTPTAPDRRMTMPRLCCAAIKEEAERRGLPLPKLRIEPGRSLSGPSGVAVGRVGAVKQGEKKNGSISTSRPTICPGRRCWTGTTTAVPVDERRRQRRPRRSISSARSAIPTRSAPSGRCRP